MKLLINGLMSGLLLISVSASALEKSQIQKNVDDPLITKPEQGISPIRKDSVINQQNYDKNDAGEEIQEDTAPVKTDTNKTKTEQTP